VREAGERVRQTLLNYCDKYGFAFTWRLKTPESLAEKIETGRFSKWSDIDDLFACTIIVPTLRHDSAVYDYCEKTFRIIKSTKKGAVKKPPDIFRFDSTRISARLLPPIGYVATNELDIYQVVFEIQIKSAFEHAWSVAIHDLAYKGQNVDWKHLRLAAQIKATVEQLDTLILMYEQVSENIQESHWPELESKHKIASKVKMLLNEGRIPSECAPKDISRFSNNLYHFLDKAKKLDGIRRTLNIIEQELKRTPVQLFPRSISLLQFFIAILVKKKVVALPIEGYIWHISESLVSIYPEFRSTLNSFDYLS
jgi:ppGpp synthetase/RelA/SpoT-type nucleotidyltranferase